MMRVRLGAGIRIQELSYGTPLHINGVRLSLHPAGHIPGSAQVRVEYQGMVWVVSGDYKTHRDGISEPLEPQKCHVFISECTFGLPVFRWEKLSVLASRLCHWVSDSLAQGQSVVISAYSLGKAQRIIRLLNEAWIVPFVHSSILDINRALVSAGVQVGNYTPLEELPHWHGPAVVIVPPVAASAPVKGLREPVVTAACSGWVSIRGMKRRQNLDQGFGISDHADWPGLLNTIRQTEAEKIILTHGFSTTLARFLSEQGLNAQPLETTFGDMEAEEE
jgi:putative mRNA 3-end processing factor